MSTAEYERLLSELSRAKNSQDRAKTGTDQPASRTAELAELEDRLLDQQADLLNAATALRLRPPQLRPDAAVKAETADFAAAIAAATKSADACEAATARALRRAELPNFLPTQRTPIRHLSVYALCVLGATLLQLLILATGELREVAWVFAGAPAAALLTGYVLIGAADRSRIRPVRSRRRRAPAPSRDPKTGLIMCLVVDFAVAAWWLLR